MKTLLLSNSKKNPKNYQAFFKSPNPNLILITKNKVYPLHREHLTQSSYFTLKLSESEKVHILEEFVESGFVNFDDLMFEAVLGYLYGINIHVERNEKVGEILRVIRFLGILELEQKIFEDFEKNFDEYSIFNLFQVAITFNISWLENKCFYQLAQLEFEHIWINRFDLLHCEKSLFERVILEFLKSGLKAKSEWSSCQLKKLIIQYNELNNHNCDLLILETKIEEQNVRSISQGKISSRRYSYPPIEEKHQTGMGKKIFFDQLEEKEKLQKIQLTSNPSLKTCFSSEGALSEQCCKNETKSAQQGEATRLNKINSDMIESCNDFRSELECIKASLSEQSESETEEDFENLMMRCEQMKQISVINDKKIYYLKKKISIFSGQPSIRSFGSEVTTNLPLESFSKDNFLSYDKTKVRKSTGPNM